MPVTDRTRKILWARSGNRCAICRCSLVLEATDADREALVGDECHIVAASPTGPRGGFTVDDVDGYNNLILLCKTDHKRIDDQVLEFPVERLRAMKREHERWAQGQPTFHRPKIRIYKAPSERDGIPVVLVPDGSVLLDIIGGCMAGHYKSEPARTRAETEMLSRFLQNVQDWNDLLDDIEVGGRVRAEFDLTEAIGELLEAGFVVYAGRVERTLDCDGERSPWPCSFVSVVRLENARRQEPAVRVDSVETARSEAG